MSDWASRRKAIYMWSVILVLTGVSFFIFWKFWYRVPSCFDRIQNGDEEGVDCGGSCSLICSAVAQVPLLRTDPRIFSVAPNIYSIVAFVENQNVAVMAPYVPYTFRIFDEKNSLLYERQGATVFEKSGSLPIFEGNIFITNGTPKRAEIELAKNIVWIKKSTEDPEIEVRNSPLLRQDSSPRIEAVVTNKSIQDIRNLELIVVVFDGRDNAIAASRTFVEKLPKNSEADIFFTWPAPFLLGEVACEKPSDVVLAIDRSGSMQSLGTNPPEPLQSVKNAASYFAGSLGVGDSLGVVSFATDATSLIDNSLTREISIAQSAINSIEIQKDQTQYTNIADALTTAFNALSLDDAASVQKVIVLLTDGVATRPIPETGLKNEAEEVAYATAAASAVASTVKQKGVMIYSIGLGKDIDKAFLSEMASSPENFVEAPSTSTLSSVYDRISTSICKEVPARIEINYKILGL